MVTTTKTAKRHRLRIIVPAFPALNIYSFSAQRTTALGPVTVATAVNEMPGWDVEVVDENNLRLYGPVSKEGGADHEVLQRFRPADVVGFYGGLTSTVPRIYRIAAFYKSKGVITIVGGQHFVEENIKEALFSDIDYVVVGEAEQAIKELLSAIENKTSCANIQGIAFLQNNNIVQTPKRAPVFDFDQFPIPDFSLVRYAKISNYPVERIRGCGMNCEFCTVKGKPRCASIDRFFQTISALVEKRDARKFFIVDDLFGQQREQTIRLCYMLRDYQKKIGKRLEFGVQIRLDKAKDTELLEAMTLAGISFIAIGFESPIDEELKAMNKNLRAEDMIFLTSLYRKQGFLIHGMFIFGYPLDGNVQFNMTAQERIKRYKSFIKKCKIDTVQILLPVPLPGTDFRKRLKRDNRLFSKEVIGWKYYDGSFCLFEPDKPLTAEQMQKAAKDIMCDFYQFKYMFFIGLNIFCFFSILFFLCNIKRGWRRWYRSWRNDLVRFGGWITLRQWKKDFNKGSFSKKLQHAQKRSKV